MSARKKRLGCQCGWLAFLVVELRGLEGAFWITDMRDCADVEVVNRAKVRRMERRGERFVLEDVVL
jgi:hypothetical protein